MGQDTMSLRNSGFADALAQVRRLAPLVAEHRQAIDRERRLPDAVFEACADAGLFRLWLPKAFGGPELSPLEFMGVVEAAAGLDGSVGWIVGNGGGMSRVAGYLPETVARAWFDDRRAFVASATGAIGSAVPVKGGYRVSGRWPFGSGAHYATRFMGLCNVADPDGSNASGPICCYFAREHVTIVDNWHVSGLRGTGSCDFEVRDLVVPSEHAHAFLDHPATQPGLLYRMPAVSVFAWTVAVVPLGIACAAADAFAELATTKMRAGTSAPLRDREIIQSEFGRADAQLRAGRAFLRDAMSELIVATDVGGERLVRARATLRTASTYAAESAVQITDRLSAAAGAIAIFETGRLERCVRDVQAAVKHAAMSPNNYVVGGRLGLGLTPGTSRF
jgi:alkylation response protein AidB-like acyl-CoA dehydrogenase